MRTIVIFNPTAGESALESAASILEALAAGQLNTKPIISPRTGATQTSTQQL